ncbi:MAG: DUF2163 domain-containing protein [Ahrensia sp.]
MRPFSDAMTRHLNGPATTLCSCWIITRTDGLKLGFTDHDRALTVSGITCEPETGLTASTAEYSAGLSTDSWSADGILSSDAITDTDLRAGLFDRAIIEQWLVNWRDTSQAQRLTRAVMGEVTIADNRYTIELRSITALLERDQTRFFGGECDAEFGDHRCGVSTQNYTRAATVLTVGDNNRVRLQIDNTIDASLFQNGHLRLTNGTFARLLQVSSLAGGTRLDIVLDRSLTSLVEGMQISVIQGCDKQFSTCRTRFGNAPNFRGFPHIPGGENTLNYADEEGQYNGEPLVR